MWAFKIRILACCVCVCLPAVRACCAYICVLLLLYMCPTTAIYVSSMVLAQVVFRGAQSWKYVVPVLLGTVCVLSYYCISIGRSKFLFDREREREREKPLLSVCV
jgi:hypothetical protein